jgi:fumarylacetoacetase
LGLGKQVWADVRSALSRLLAAPAPPEELTPGDFVVAMDKVDLLLPIAIGDYVDFYSSVEHATNVGKLFRPGEPPLPPNWRHLPIGYQGRTSSVVVYGTPIHRPQGQRHPPGGDVGFGPSTRLDFELEISFITGGGNIQGSPITAAAAEESIFGMCLVNDWLARNIQAWEYRPLDPFLSKSFATSMSPWIVQLETLAGQRVPAPAQDPAPLPYLT